VATSQDFGVFGVFSLKANSVDCLTKQETICVAMDFPGWREPATVIFFLSGAAGIGRMEIEGRWVCLKMHR